MSLTGVGMEVISGSGDCPGAGGTPLRLAVLDDFATISAAVQAAESDASDSDIRIDIAPGDHVAMSPIKIQWNHGCSRYLGITGPDEGRAEKSPRKKIGARMYFIPSRSDPNAELQVSTG